MSDSAKRRTEVLIVGAGPTGLTAALELTRMGHAVRVIEKNLKRSSFSKALGITAATLKFLTPCEAAPRLIEAGRKVRCANFRRGDQHLGAIDFSQLPKPWNYLVVLPQSETENILESRLAELGVNVERGIQWTDLQQDESTVTAKVEDANGTQSEIISDYLLAADGARSGIRNNLSLEFPGHSLPEKWQLADIRGSLPVETNGPTIIVGDKRLLFVICIRDDLFRIVSNHGDPQAHLPTGSKVHEVVWQSDFSIHHRQVDAYQVGRVFLAGDSAHIHSPLGGRGMNLGIEDAAEFARLLDHRQLQDYSWLRHEKGADIVKTVSTMTRLLSSSDRAPRMFRRFLLPLLLRLPFVTRRIALRMVDA